MPADVNSKDLPCSISVLAGVSPNSSLVILLQTIGYNEAVVTSKLNICLSKIRKSGKTFHTIIGRTLALTKCLENLSFVLGYRFGM